MLAKNNYETYLKEKRKYYAELLYEKINKENLKKDLIFSYLGARICYYSDYPIRILFEEKFLDKRKRTQFLLNLYKKKHFSIFAHTPIVIDLSDINVETRERIFKYFFKVFPIDEFTAMFTLRHFTENLPEEKFKELIDIGLYDWRKDNDFMKSFELKSNIVIELSEFNARYLQSKLFVFNSSIPEWKVVLAYNISRICSHQWIRHTTINFNQRSHRYTDVDAFCLPYRFQEDYDLFNRIYIDFQDLYGLYTSLKVKERFRKEELRFLMPQGTATTLIASAPIFVWKDFVEKRCISQAQEEIREIAKILRKVLFNNKIGEKDE